MTAGPGEERLPYAAWDARVRALLLDLLVVLLAAAIGCAVGYAVEGDAVSVDFYEEDGRLVRTETPRWIFWGAGGGLLALLLYLWLALGLMRGQTLGRRAVGIRVVLTDGQPIGIGRAFVREVLAKTALGLLSIPLLLSYLWPIWDRRKRALHDMIVSTRVVRVDGVMPDASAPPPPAAPAGWAPPSVPAPAWDGRGGFAPPQAPGGPPAPAPAPGRRPDPPVPPPPTPPPLP